MRMKLSFEVVDYLLETKKRALHVAHVWVALNSVQRKAIKKQSPILADAIERCVRHVHL